MGIAYEDFEPLIIVLAFGILGFVVAMIMKTLNDNKIIVNEYLTGTITITTLMSGIIVLFLIVGIVVAATRQS